MSEMVLLTLLPAVSVTVTTKLSGPLKFELGVNVKDPVTESNTKTPLMGCVATE